MVAFPRLLIRLLEHGFASIPSAPWKPVCRSDRELRSVAPLFRGGSRQDTQETTRQTVVIGGPSRYNLSR